MAVEVLLPRQGNTVEACVILEWRVEVGSTVATGDVLCEVETDKATFEVESTAEGTLLKRVYEEGDEVPVLEVIALIGDAGEDVSAYGGRKAGAGSAGGDSDTTEKASDTAPSMQTASSSRAAGTGSATANVDGSALPAGNASVASFPDGHIPISPRARRIAHEENIEYTGISGSGPGGRIIERDVQAALTARGPMTAAARAAAEGSSFPESGTGFGGRVRLGDLSDATASQAVVAETSPAAMTFPGAAETIPVRSVRKIVAERMLASLTQAAQLTLNTSTDAGAMMRYRKKCKASADPQIQGITLNDFCLFGVSRALKEFPDMNAHFLGDRIVRFENVHLGFAVDTPRGLMVPVIRNADTLSLKQIAAESKRLATGCMEGTIDPDLLSGGTFTVTNLGALGIESFTPVLNLPQVGILGLCAITPKPVLRGEETLFVPHMGLSLTFDHQAVDGAPAARFLKRYAEILADFELSLAG